MLHILEHALEHTFFDTIRLVPFLLLTYLAMEYLEHRSEDKVNTWIQRSGRLGPLIGSILGIVPQCGFSAAASNLYAGRVITVGTLLAIYLSTSDEMLFVLIAGNVEAREIAGILLCKVAVAMIAGFIIDFVWRRVEEPDEHMHIHEICEHEHCQCEKGVLRSAFSHTLQITVFIFLISFILEIVLHIVGEENLANILMIHPMVGPFLAGIVGLIPNCASSVMLTQLYVEEILSIGTMMAGLLVNAGVGLLVLFRVNHDKKENLKILGILYVIGVITGIVMEILR